VKLSDIWTSFYILTYSCIQYLVSRLAPSGKMWHLNVSEVTSSHSSYSMPTRMVLQCPMRMPPDRPPCGPVITPPSMGKGQVRSCLNRGYYPKKLADDFKIFWMKCSFFFALILAWGVIFFKKFIYRINIKVFFIIINDRELGTDNYSISADIYVNCVFVRYNSLFKSDFGA